jgi:hypothetical protein
MKTMSNATMETTSRPGPSTNGSWLGTGFEIPRFEIPNVVMPVAFRDFLENSAAQAKENFEIKKAGTDTMAEQVDTTYTNVALGLFDLTRKMFDVARDNTKAGFNFTAQLMTVKSPWEMAVLSSTHAREQFEAISERSREVAALARKLTT